MFQKKNSKKSRVRLKFETVFRGVYGYHTKEFKKAVVINSEEDAISKKIKSEIISRTDFKTHFLCYIAGGQFKTGGYNVFVKRIFQLNSDLLVFAKIKFDEEAKAQTMATTRPYAICKIEKPNLEGLDLAEGEWVINKKEHKAYYMKDKKKKKKRKKKE